MISSAPPSKRLLAGLLARAGFLNADLALRATQTVLAVNYHGTPAAFSASLRAQLMFLRERFQCLNEDQLLRFLSGGLLLQRPGVVICFDDGSRDNAAVAAPLLDELGLVGWFMIPGGFLDQAPGDQAAYFRRWIRPLPSAEHPEHTPPRAMTWDGVRRLAERGHVIGCHTWSHRPLGGAPSADAIQEEVVGARDRLQQRTGRLIRSFAWVRGQPGDYSATAQQVVRHTYQLAFLSMGGAISPLTSPWGLHRFNLEASFPGPVVRFQLSHLNERLFDRRRRAVDRLLEVAPTPDSPSR